MKPWREIALVAAVPAVVAVAEIAAVVAAHIIAPKVDNRTGVLDSFV
jgi:hypothetical protein